MRRTSKLAAKRESCAETMRHSLCRKIASRGRRIPASGTARWVRHRCSAETDRVKTLLLPACSPDPGAEWHRERSLDEIEANQNAGQRSLL